MDFFFYFDERCSSTEVRQTVSAHLGIVNVRTTRFAKWMPNKRQASVTKQM
jgi:hypothetical protein